MVNDPQTSEDDYKFAKYFISPDAAEASGRSLPVLIATRRCYMCQQGEDEMTMMSADPEELVAVIQGHCSQQQDYLLPDTPMKEAIFRTLLAAGNDPMDANEISDSVANAWALTQFPRNTSPEVIQRLLDNSEYYCLAEATEA